MRSNRIDDVEHSTSNLATELHESRAFSFEDIPISFPDALRAQYYLNSLEKKSRPLFKSLIQRTPEISLTTYLIKDFFSSLTEELDQLILPTIVQEMAIARSIGALSGKTPKARYESFFLSRKGYTLLSLSVLERYYSLFQTLDMMIDQAVKSCLHCLDQLSQDFPLLVKEGLVMENDFLTSIDLLKGSDPHMQKRTFLLAFASGNKIIHKSVDLTSDQLFGEFLCLLALPAPYNLRCAKVVPKGNNYGWIQYIPHQECKSYEQVRNFYKRAGALIAVADCLNYTDGHFDNLIAAGDHPILIDGETFFQNYASPQRKPHQKKNLLATSLVQKPPAKKAERGYYAAFQVAPLCRLEVVHPYALHDQSDKIELHYRGIREEKSINCPILDQKPQMVHHFIEDVLEGFSVAFDLIKAKKNIILANSTWWDRVSLVKSRTVIRETLAYFYLLRRIQRPEACISKVTMRNILASKLGETPYTAYEIKELLQMNIPYFYQYPGQPHLYQGDGKRHSHAFIKTGVELLKEQLVNWDNDYKQLSYRILNKHLCLTPAPGNLTYYSG